MKNISNIKNCYGCGVCAIACSKKIIHIQLNHDGFYEPHIDLFDKCTECGICLDVCAYNHRDLSLSGVQIQSWAAWSNDDSVRRKCSSGGLSFEIGKHLIKQGYKAVGCRYNVDCQRAEHYISTTIEEFIQSIGSKYIQSYTEKAFKAINRKQKYFITGTPCQIDSFRRYAQKFKCEENFILIDFFCHGVPSKLMWDKYVIEAEKKVGKLIYVSWRNKFTGWHDSWAMAIDGIKHGEPVDWNESYNNLMKEKECFFNSRFSQGDIFYRFFLGDICLGKACYNKCKYKYNKSSADIRIGDLWGNTYRENEYGVNALVTFTTKGRQLVNSLENITFIEHPFHVVAEGQMKENAKPKIITPVIMLLLRSNISLSNPLYKMTFVFQRILNKLGIQ